MSMSNRYDTIVIGSGCGGGAAAALMRHLGHKTLLLEKNHTQGGRASTTEKDGFKLDHGHIIMRSEKGPHGEVLRLIGRPDLIPRFSHCMGWPLKVVVSGINIDWVPTARRALLTPNFFKQSRQFQFTIKERLQMLRFAVAVRRMNKTGFQNINYMDMKTWMSQYTTNNHCHSFIGGLAVVAFGAFIQEASAGELVRVIQNGLKDRIAMGYPVNGEGVAAIPNSFVRAAEELGCDIRTNSQVKGIIIENGRATGVRVNGTNINAKNIISAVGVKETVKHLVGREHFDNRYADRIESLRYSLGGMSLKYGLKKKITNINWGGDIPDRIAEVGDDMMSGRIPHRFPVMFVSPSNIDSRLAPPGTQSMSFLSGGPPVEPGTIDWSQWVDKMKAQVEETFPGLKENALFCEVTTPDQIARFSGRCFGDAVGVAQSKDQVGDRRPSPISPIKGLYFAGADVGKQNCATELASESAIALYEHFKR